MIYKCLDIDTIKKQPTSKLLKYSKVTKTPLPIRPKFTVKNSSIISMSLDLNNRKNLTLLDKRRSKSNVFQTSSRSE